MLSSMSCICYTLGLDELDAEFDELHKLHVTWNDCEHDYQFVINMYPASGVKLMTRLVYILKKKRKRHNQFSVKFVHTMILLSTNACCLDIRRQNARNLFFILT